MAKAKKPTAVRRASKPAHPRKTVPKAQGAARSAAKVSKAQIRVLPTSLADSARDVLARSGWGHAGPELAKDCRALISRLSRTCPFLVVDRPLAASEVAGEIDIKQEDFRGILLTAAGAKSIPRTVWSDGANELLVETNNMELRTEDGFAHVSIPVYCEETGKQQVTVSFATGSADNPAGLIFVADTTPEGPAEIVEIWGEALVNLAWVSLLRSVATLADVAGRDLDGAGLLPAAFSAGTETIKLQVMARHEFDRIIK